MQDRQTLKTEIISTLDALPASSLRTLAEFAAFLRKKAEQTPAASERTIKPDRIRADAPESTDEAIKAARRKRRLEQYIAQEKTALNLYARKIEALGKDLGRESDEWRRRVLQERLDEAEKEYAETKARVERLEQELVSLGSGNEPKDPGTR